MTETYILQLGTWDTGRRLVFGRDIFEDDRFFTKVGRVAVLLVPHTSLRSTTLSSGTPNSNLINLKSLSSKNTVHSSASKSVIGKIAREIEKEGKGDKREEDDFSLFEASTGSFCLRIVFGLHSRSHSFLKPKKDLLVINNLPTCCWNPCSCLASLLH